MKKFLSAILLLTLLLTCVSCTSYPQETRMAKEYIGMTFGEIKALWGDDCTLGGDLYEGAEKGVCYADERTPYIFLFDEEPTDLSSLSDDTAVTVVRAPGGEGKPCEAMIGMETYDELFNYNVRNNDYNEKVTRWNLHIKDEETSTRFIYLLTSYEEPTSPELPPHIEIDDDAAPVAYEVYITPEEYRQKQYYHDIDKEELVFFDTFNAWPNENWDGNTWPDEGTMQYHLDYGEWPDPDAVTEFVETGIWPEDAYAPYPYDDIARIHFYNEFAFYPPENWDHSDPSYNEICYLADYGEWPDPNAVTEFIETGHWPEDAYVPYPYSDSWLLDSYKKTGEWPEGTDLSELPPLPEE